MVDLELRNDTELYNLLRSPDKAVRERVFVFIYEKYGSKVRDYCLKSYNFDKNGEDAFHDTIVRFYELIDKYDEVTNIPAILIRIARNIILNSKKRNKAIEYSSPDVEEQAKFEEDDDDDLDDNDLKLKKKISKAIDLLTPEYKEPFLLHMYADMSYQEIADELQLTVPSVRNRIMRAKIRLRTLLSPYIQH